MLFTWVLAMQLWNQREDRLDPWQMQPEEKRQPMQPANVPREPDALVA